MNDVEKFLDESNKIESVYSQEAYEDALLAWKNALEYSEISEDMILSIHYFLMKNLNERIAGRFRNCDVWVGHKQCPNPILIPDLLENWLMKYRDVKTEKEIMDAHIAFEGIYPFEDGNGRTGRIILNWQRAKNNLPILIIHADWHDEEGEQRKYYNLFN
ncbi:MAG: Fic family protein [Candidatus Woesearchaeota archaeon]|jgi:Fic family protein